MQKSILRYYLSEYDFKNPVEKELDIFKFHNSYPLHKPQEHVPSFIDRKVLIHEWLYRICIKVEKKNKNKFLL